MAETPREELAELARLLSAHIAWQRTLGVVELPRDGVLPAGRLAVRPAVEVVAARVAAAPELPAAVVVPAVAPVAVQPVPAPVPVGSSPAPAPVAVGPAARPVVLTLFEAPVDAPSERGPALEGEARIAALRVVDDDVKACTRCRLANGRRNTVFARGNPFARLCFVGEGPGEQEDLKGLPFVGPAGQLLDKIIGAMGLSPDEVYVANIVKCRPPGNRVPESDEMAACTPFLVRQLEIVRPEVIVALGRTAVGFLLQSRDSMSRLRGQWQSYQGIPVLPTWHPAYLLRNPDAKGDTWADMKLVLERLELPLPRRGA